VLYVTKYCYTIALPTKGNNMNKQKLSKRTQKDLAVLFNSIEVAQIMKDEAHKESDHDSYTLWDGAWATAIIKLNDDYGIKLPCLDSAIDKASKGAK